MPGVLLSPVATPLSGVLARVATPVLAAPKAVAASVDDDDRRSAVEEAKIPRRADVDQIDDRIAGGIPGTGGKRDGHGPSSLV